MVGRPIGLAPSLLAAFAPLRLFGFLALHRPWPLDFALILSIITIPIGIIGLFALLLSTGLLLLLLLKLLPAALAPNLATLNVTL